MRIILIFLLSLVSLTGMKTYSSDFPTLARSEFVFAWPPILATKSKSAELRGMNFTWLMRRFLRALQLKSCLSGNLTVELSDRVAAAP